MDNENTGIDLSVLAGDLLRAARRLWWLLPLP